MNVEFAPPDDTSGEYPSGPVEYHSEPSWSHEESTNVLDPETEARVKAQHERYMKAAPVPGGGAVDARALEEQGFTVRVVEG